MIVFTGIPDEGGALRQSSPNLESAEVGLARGHRSRFAFAPPASRGSRAGPGCVRGHHSASHPHHPASVGPGLQGNVRAHAPVSSFVAERGSW